MTMDTIGAGVDASVTDPFHDEYRRRTHFSGLDGLRFVCIAAVIWAPLAGDPRDTGLLSPAVAARVPRRRLLLRPQRVPHHHTAGAGARAPAASLRAFYWRRLLRIVPVSYALIAAVSIFLIVVEGETQWAALVPFYVLFLANFLTESIPFLSPLWSLAVEEQYYLVWLLLVLIVTPLFRLVLPLLAAGRAQRLAGHHGLRPRRHEGHRRRPAASSSLPNATYAAICSARRSCWCCTTVAASPSHTGG